MQTGAKYRLQVPGPDAVLVYSFIGYASQEIAASQSGIDVAMVADAEQLGEVVVVAYGTQKKETPSPVPSPGGYQPGNCDDQKRRTARTCSVVKIPGLRVRQNLLNQDSSTAASTSAVSVIHS